MKKTEIRTGVHFVEPASMKNFTACAGMIIDAGEKLVIDTNTGPDSVNDFLAAEKPVKAVVSHYHLDHSIWSSAVLKSCDAELFIPVEEEKYISDIDYFVANTAAPYGQGESWGAFIEEFIGFHGAGKYTLYKGDHEFMSGSLVVQAVDTPGHSPGHKSFYLPEEKILFTGDMGIDRFGPWYGWPDCDLALFVDSIKKLKSLEVDTLLTSHGGILTDGITEAWDRVLQKIFDNEKKVQKWLEKELSREDMIEKGLFYGDKSKVREPMRTFLYMWDEVTLDKHFEILKTGSLREQFE